MFVYDSDKLIGMGRDLCDGEYQIVIYDMVVLPEYQGRGVGREIINGLCDQLVVENIILYAVPGREGFYERYGFKKKRSEMAKLNEFMSNPNSHYLEP